ncbi:hypothetical protein BH11PLA1_BH11PLA1_06420 [soil metagenome]
MRHAPAGSLLVFSALGLLALAGCQGHGTYTQQALEAQKMKANLLKGDVQWQMAQQQYLAGDLEKALKGVDNAIDMSPKSAKAHVLRGRILLELGNLELARQSFEQAGTLNPVDVDAQYFMGIVCERMTELDEAQRRYEAAMKLDETNPQYVIAAAETMASRNLLPEANALLAQKSKAFPHNAGIRQLQGQFAMLESDFGKAADLLAEARLLSPDDAGIQEELARAQFSAQRFGDAEFTLQMLIKTAGATPRRDLIIMHTRCLMNLERLGEARQALIKFTADAEGMSDIQAWFDLGQVCIKMNDPQRVRLAGGRLVSIAPERAEGYLLRAMFARMTSDLPAALTAINDAIRLNPKEPSAFSIRALIAQQMGNTQQAQLDSTHAAELAQLASATKSAAAAQTALIRSDRLAGTGSPVAAKAPFVPAATATASVPTE